MTEITAAPVVATTHAGGYKQSGPGREVAAMRIEELLETEAVQL